MKLTGWATALAAAGLTPAAAAVPQAAAPQAQMQAAQEAAPVTGTPSAGETDPTATQMATVPFEHAIPEDRIGYPSGNRGIQPQVTELGRQGADFHDYNLLLWCAAISLFVLGLLTYAIVRFRRARNPEPSRTSHHTLLEVGWTVVPVLILVIIAIPSMRLLRAQYSPPPADLTIKVIGNQWYWTYQFPDHGDFEIVSNMLREQSDVGPGQRFRTDADGPPLLAVDERLVIPAGKVVKFIVTSSDVIHSFGIPAFWAKIDANPGQLNETWAKVDRPGVYFGQCYELCGARHAYMPIAVEVVPEARFAAWVAAKGGTMPGAEAAPAITDSNGAAEPQSNGSQPASGETIAAQN